MMETLMESHLMSQLNKPKSTHFALKTNLCNRTQSKQLGQANFLFPLAFHLPQFSHLAHSTFSFSDCLNQEWGLLRPILDIYGDLHHRIWPGKGLGLGSHSAPIIPPSCTHHFIDLPFSDHSTIFHLFPSPESLTGHTL